MSAAVLSVTVLTTVYRVVLWVPVLVQGAAAKSIRSQCGMKWFGRCLVSVCLIRPPSRKLVLLMRLCTLMQPLTVTLVTVLVPGPWSVLNCVKVLLMLLVLVSRVLSVM